MKFILFDAENNQKIRTKLEEVSEFTHLQPLQGDAIVEGVGWNSFDQVVADVEAPHLSQALEVLLGNRPHRAPISSVGHQVGKTDGDLHREEVDFLASPEAQAGYSFPERCDRAAGCVNPGVDFNVASLLGSNVSPALFSDRLARHLVATSLR